MSNSNLHYRRNYPLGAAANDLGVPVSQVVADFALPGVKAAAQAAFAAGRAAISRWALVEEIGPVRHISGAIDTMPPIPAAEDGALDAVQAYADERSPRAGIVGLSWTVSDQDAAIASLDSLARQGADVGRTIALSCMEAITDELASTTFGAGQREAAALSVSALQSALAKQAALRGPHGGHAPPAAILLAAPDLAAVIANLWPGAIAGLSVHLASTLPAAKWYLLPSPAEAVIAFDISSTLAVRAHNATAAAESGLVISAATSESPLILRASDGSVRWVVAGGV